MNPQTILPPSSNPIVDSVRQSARIAHRKLSRRFKLAGALLCATAFSTAIIPAYAEDLVPSSSFLRTDGKRVVTFKAVANGTWTIPAGVTEVEVLVVGGGGAGARGGAFGGPSGGSPGGGAGGLYYSTTHSVTPEESVNLIVGAGAPTTTSNGSGGNGNHSVFGNIIAYGGQGGQEPTNQGGNQGGHSTDAGANITPGFLGGTGNGATGGAGAGENGRNGDFSPAYGGAGVAVPITGSGPLLDIDGNAISGFYGNMIGYAGGGSAGFDGKELGSTRGESYGGGSGSEPENTAGTPGFNTLGGGGGGGRGANGGAGGSGVVIIAYTDAAITSYTVSFDSNGGSAVDSQIVPENLTATEPSNPTLAGSTFSGWFTDEALTLSYDFATPVTADITLYAAWTVNYTVSFDSNGGSAVSSQEVPENGTATEPADPSLTGSTFNGWFTDEELTLSYDFETPVTSNITLYAKWTINSYTLTYTAGANGSITGDSPQSVDHGSSGTAVTAVPDAGYLFLKWSDDSLANPRTDSNVTGNIAVTALFAEIPPPLLPDTVTTRGDGKTVATFSTVGSGTWTVPSGATEIEVLVVGGGGGGGVTSTSSGGGAGGVYFEENVTLAGDVVIMVGDGGAIGGAGENSVLGDIIAFGGRPGQSNDGSGGASGGYSVGGGATTGVFAGGGPNFWMGGGGGAGQVGFTGLGDYGAPVYNSGGNGLEYAITGSPTYYGGGGGNTYVGGYRGNEDPPIFNGGLGGGGAGDASSDGGGPATPGVDGLGGGGGGGRNSGGAAGGSGVVIIAYVVDDTPATPYDLWAALYGDADLSDPQADFDGDGLSNFYEFAFGLDPTSGASVNPITDISELQADGIFSYTRNADSDLSYTYWISTDLQDWGDEPVEALLEEAGEIDDDGVQTVVVVLDLPESDKVFLRVKAE